MGSVRWERYALLAEHPRARTWLTIQADFGLAASTIDAYARSLDDYVAFSVRHSVEVDTAGREHVAAYARDLRERQVQRGSGPPRRLADATLQLRFTVLRLYYDFLIEEAVRSDHPVGRGRYTPGKGFGGRAERGLIPRYRRLPWIPGDDEWRAVLDAAQRRPVRDRAMLALAYDGALRREELSLLATGDVDPSARLLHLRAETTKGRRARTVPYSAATGELLRAYLDHRAGLTRARGALFLSESNRNFAQSLSAWTWSKTVWRLARDADLPRFTTHTPRHLRLTDLARSGWDLHEIAQFAGHRNTQTTLLYVHLSGRDLAAKLERGMAEIHAWRSKLTAEALA